MAAQIFAARDSATLVLSQKDLDLYFDRWSRAVAAEPLLAQTSPRTYRNVPPSLDVWTMNPGVLEKCADRQVGAISDPEFVALLNELDPDPVFACIASSDGRTEALFHVKKPYNEEILAIAVASLSSSLDDPVHTSQFSDGTWAWLGNAQSNGDDVAQIDIWFGWGDCLVACAGTHRLRALVSGHGPATVYDVGGDPLPDYLHLSPTTKPLPP